jgi:hypothetical protein
LPKVKAERRKRRKKERKNGERKEESTERGQLDHRIAALYGDLT